MANIFSEISKGIRFAAVTRKVARETVQDNFPNASFADQEKLIDVLLKMYTEAPRFKQDLANFEG